MNVVVIRKLIDSLSHSLRSKRLRIQDEPEIEPREKWGENCSRPIFGAA